MPTITLPGGRPVDVGADQIGQSINSNLLGNTPGGYSPAYGGVPQIPNPIASQWQAIGGDINSLPSLFSLGNAYNLFNYDQRLGQIAGTPGFSNVLANQAGVIPQDVSDRLALQGAQRGISTGLTNSPNSNASLMQALGLTSLDLKKLGQQQYSDLLGHFQGAAPFDISKFLVSPEEQQAANTAANVSAAAPNPQAAAQEEFRKLLEAIQAGHNTGAGGVGASGGLPDLSALLNGLRNNRNPGYTEPGNTVLSSLAGNPPGRPNDAIINAWRDQFANPNTATPPPGRPSDAVQNAGGNQSLLQQMLANPSYGNSPMLGGLGLNPVLNTVLGGLFGGGGGGGIGTGGGPTIDNLGSIGQGPEYGPPWADTSRGITQNAPSDWWNQSDPYSALSNTDWLNMPAQGNTAPWADTAPWQPDANDPFGINNILSEMGVPPITENQDYNFSDYFG